MNSSYAGTATQQQEVPDTTLGLLNTIIGLATDLEVGTGGLADGISGSIPVSAENNALKQPSPSDVNSQLRILLKSLKNTTKDFQRARNGIGI